MKYNAIQKGAKATSLLCALLLSIPIYIAAQGMLSPQSYVLAAQQSQHASIRYSSGELLEDVLSGLAKEYNIDFVYETSLVKGKVITEKIISHTDLSTLLAHLLRPFELDFQRIGENNYVIFPQSRTIEKSATYQVKKEQINRKNLPIPTNISEKIRGVSITMPEVKIAFDVIGTVVDEEGAPLEGATVLLKGSKVGTLTNSQGEFSISLPDESEDGTLVVTYLGYERQEIPIRGRNRIDIVMNSTISSLDEVVVIGYGTKQRKDITGAVSKITTEELNSVAIQSLDQALQGRAPGVVVTQNSGEPGGNVSVRIRGVGSTGNNEPLYVIDGFPVYNDNQRSGSAGFSDTQFNALSSLNPNDIESIEVLKDASAAAIYGARAANGVVLITTKRGKAGEAKVSIDSYIGFQEAWNIPDFLNASEFAEIANEAYVNSGEEPNPEWANPSALGEGTNWMDEIFRRGLIQSHDIGIRGGTEKTQASLSLGYFNQEGTIINSDFERYSLRGNVDFQASDKLKFGANTYISYSDQNVIRTNNFANGVFNIAQMMLPTIPPDGVVDGPALYYSTALDNPVLLSNAEDSDLSMIRSLNSVFASYEILPGLTYKINLGVDLIQSRSTRWLPTYERGLAINLNANSWERRTEDITWLIENTLTYQKTFADKHNLLLLAGQSSQKSNFSSITASGSDFQNNDIRIISASNPDLRGAGGNANQWSLASYFGRINYDFNDKYLFTASLRVDGSSRFGPENKWGVFPSFSAGWRLSNEPFLENVTWINDLKLRASWGQLGSDRIGDFGFLNVYTLGGVEYTFSETGLPGATLNRLGNPDLRWETSTQTDIGLDLYLFNSKLYMNADYFIKDTEDLLVAVPIPQIVGIPNSPFVNAGEVRNQGFELAIGHQNGNDEFYYDISLNFATLDNEVLDLGQGQPIAGGTLPGADRFSPTLTEVGFPIGYFFGFVVDGIYQTEEEIDPEFAPLAVPGDFRFRDVDGDGVLTDDDRTFIGSPIPDFTYGLNIKFEWKGFDVNAFIQGVQGNEIFSTIKQQTFQIPYFNGSGVTNSVTDMLNRWTGPGTSNTIPRVAYNDLNGNYPRSSTFYIEDGSFTRMRNLAIGYQLPPAIINRWGLSRLRFYASVQNLFTITDYSGFDPEIGDFNQNALTSGVDNGNYPVPRTYRAGVNIEF